MHYIHHTNIYLCHTRYVIFLFRLGIHINILYLTLVSINPIKRLKSGSKVYRLHHEGCTVGKSGISETHTVILCTWIEYQIDYQMTESE